MKRLKLWATLLAVLFGSLPCWAETLNVQFPISRYYANDACLDWGGLNDNYVIAGAAGKHVGDDVFCGKIGDPVFAIADGEVKFASEWKLYDVGNWGYLTTIEHTLSDGSRITSLYGHMRPLVLKGQMVKKGQLVAEITDLPWSGWTDHLYFALYNGAMTYNPYNAGYPDKAKGYLSQSAWPGNYLDPLNWIKDKAINLRYTTPHAGRTITDIIGQKDGGIH